jgi:NAD(P)-dependent dehydrogenase (short-subunit alcohol dehydrogenase family)
MRVLVTGAGGNIGSTWARHASAVAAGGGGHELRLTDVNAEALEAVADCGEVVVADMGDLDAVKSLCAGMEVVVHLAGNPDPSATWESLHAVNVVGTYHAFVAAKAAGCRRVVFASSIHAVSGYEPDVQVKTWEPVNPGDLYGVSKCFGEALGRYMAEQEGLSVLALRIGAFQPPETAAGERGAEILDYFVSHRDLCQLIDRSVEAPADVRWAILHGLSENRFKRLDLSDTRRRVGYAPVDDAARLHEPVRAALPEEPSPGNVHAPGQESGLRADL